MKETAKTTVKEVVKKAEPAKKETAAKKVEPAKKETAAKKVEPAKKETVAKKTTTAKKATTKKTEVKASVSVQFDGKSYTTEELVKIAKDVWKYDLKKKVGDFKTVEIFVKPEESMAYYVINGTVMGSFGI